jgi:EAL domain-containing protein (putative c-di-GMP-specific phosphodiesterase class I)
MSHAVSLIDTLPDLVVMVRRDGVILEHAGGQALSRLQLTAATVGARIDAVWPAALAAPVRQLIRRAMSVRTWVEARVRDQELAFEVRVGAQGPDRVLCLIRLIGDTSSTDPDLPERSPEEAEDRLPFEQRDFVQRFRDALAMAALREMPAAVAIIQLEGVVDVARIVDSDAAEQLLAAALARLPPPPSEGEPPVPGTLRWQIGPLRDQWLGAVLETSDRTAIENCLACVCESLRQPICLGDAMFELTPYAGVSILGRDASTPGGLIKRARAAAAEACRLVSPRVHFFSDTLRLRSLARLDLARELREAIAKREIGLRYVGRHDLSTGELVAWVAYLQWVHPLRGEIRPADFLAVAESTGLALLLSRSALERLGADLAARTSPLGPDIRISFGPLRHHILHAEFAADVARFIDSGAVPAGQLELRIAEKTIVAGDLAACDVVQRLGVQMIVDEVGRGIGSIDVLARASIHGLQLDRSWVTELRRDEVALKVCRAAIGLANALGLPPIATGVDDEEQRRGLLALGCRFGSGDLYRDCDSALPMPPEQVRIA